MYVIKFPDGDYQNDKGNQTKFIDKAKQFTSFELAAKAADKDAKVITKIEKRPNGRYKPLSHHAIEKPVQEAN